MKKIIIPLIAVLALSFTSTELLARRGDRGHRKGPMGQGHHHGMFFGNPEVLREKLGLSEKQMEKISTINLEYKKKMLKIREQIAPKKIRLKRMLLKDNVDLNKVRSLLKEISALKVEIRMLRIRQRLDIEKILSPAQRTKLRNSRPGRGKRMGPPSPPPEETGPCFDF